MSEKVIWLDIARVQQYFHEPQASEDTAFLSHVQVNVPLIM